jgi:cytochrome c1
MISATNFRVALAAVILLGIGVHAAAAQEDAELPTRQSWSFAGPFGKYDTSQLQRGFKIYREVCSACHSIKMLSFRNLADAGGPGFSEAQAKAVAESYKIQDGPNDQGEMFERPGRLADHFPAPFPNEQAARASNGAAAPPDMSVLAKGRTYERGFPLFVLDIFTQYQEQGPDYISSLLKGFSDPPQGTKLPEGSYYNKYFPGHAIKMPPPIQDGQVKFDDGTPETLDQYSKDISSFLMWAAEPKLDARKRTGFQVMIFLIVFSVLLYFTKKRVWLAVQLNPEQLADRSLGAGEYKSRI